MPAVEVTNRKELPNVIRLVIQAVCRSKLAIQIENVAEKGAAVLRIKQKPLAVRNASGTSLT